MWKWIQLCTLVVLAVGAHSVARDDNASVVIVVHLADGEKGVTRVLNTLDSTMDDQVHVLHARRNGTISLLMAEKLLHKALASIRRYIKSRDTVTVNRVNNIPITDGWRRRRRRRAVRDFLLESYNTVDSIMEFLNELATKYPDLCETEVIGSTFEGNNLTVIKVHGSEFGKPRARVFIDGAQHAREWLSPAVLVYLVNQLVTGYAANESWMVALLDRYEFHIMPVMNPDGYVYSYNNSRGRYWRKNRKNIDDVCVGVDLNRNWDFHWSGRGGSPYRCSELYYGTKEFSEEETKAVSSHISRYNGSWHSYFSFHSYGQMLLFPWSHTATPSPDFNNHLSAGQAMAYGIKQLHDTIYKVGSVRGVLYAASGSSESWAYARGRVPYTFTLELPDLYNFILPKERIAPAAKEILMGFRYYFEHIEARRPGLYDQLVNISRNYLNLSQTTQQVDTTQQYQTTQLAKMTRTADTTHSNVTIQIRTFLTMQPGKNTDKLQSLTTQEAQTAGNSYTTLPDLTALQTHKFAPAMTDISLSTTQAAIATEPLVTKTITTHKTPSSGGLTTSELSRDRSTNHSVIHISLSKDSLVSTTYRSIPATSNVWSSSSNVPSSLQTVQSAMLNTSRSTTANIRQDIIESKLTLATGKGNSAVSRYSNLSLVNIWSLVMCLYHFLYP